MHTTFQLKSCHRCLHHSRWKNDKGESGCLCYIGYDTEHEKNCLENLGVRCEKYFDDKKSVPE